MSKRLPYNSKKFLLPNSERSMACYHAKVMEDGVMKLTIHDCKGSIQLHNDLNDPEQIAEALNKLATLELGIYDLRNYIAQNFDSAQLSSEPISDSEMRKLLEIYFYHNQV